MKPEDRIRSAFSDLSRQADAADPEPSLAELEPPAPARARPWLRAVAAAAVVVVAVGVIALAQRGDDPIGAAGQSTTSTSLTETSRPAVTDTTQPAATAVTEATAAIPQQPGYLLADRSGATAMLSDGTARPLTDRPAEVAFDDGRGGLVYQDPTGAIHWVTGGEVVQLAATGALQQVVEQSGRSTAIVIERSEVPDTEVFEGRVVGVDLDSNEPQVLHEGGDVIGYRVAGDYVVLTTAAEEASAISVTTAGQEVFTTSELSGAVLRNGVIGSGPEGRLRVAYFRNDLAANRAVVVVQDPDGGNPVQYEVPNGVGMWLDVTDGYLAVTHGDGFVPTGFAIIEMTTGEVRQPPFPGTATVLRGTTPAPVMAAAEVEGDGWRVVGVAPDDFLNVRTGPGVEFERIGRLFPGDTEVELTGAGIVDFDGTGWYEVRLIDGTEGFANRAFLAPPAAWEVDFETLACGGGSEPGQSAPTPAPPSEGTVGSIVNGWAYVPGSDCDRYVIVLGTGISFDGRLAPADHVPAGLAVAAEGGRIGVSLPDVVDVEAMATIDLFDTTFALIVQPADVTAPLEARLLRPAASAATVTALSNPARIVVDVWDTGPTTVASPVFGGRVTLLEQPIDPDPPGQGVASPVRVVGYARWFEGQGLAEVRLADGSTAGASMTGPSVQSDSPGNPVLVGATWSPTWGEFILEITAEPGDYVFSISDECMQEETGAPAEPCGVEEAFTVAG